MTIAPGIKIIWGREMRGGLEGGHSHISWSSIPILKGPGVWADCLACVKWAADLSADIGLTDTEGNSVTYPYSSTERTSLS